MTTITSGHRGRYNEILPTDATSWGDLATSPYASWANWTTWHPQPNNIVITETVDAGSTALRQPLLEMTSQGTASTVLDISTAGTFTGEETSIDLSDGSAKTFVTGRYYRWTVTIAPDSNTLIPAASDLSPSFNETLVEEILSDVDVPSTATDSSGFTLISNNLGSVVNVQATALQGDAYVEAGYIIDAQNAAAGYVRTAETITNNGVTTSSSVYKVGTGSLRFDGSSNMSLSNTSNRYLDYTQDFTIEAWVRVDAPSGTSQYLFNIPDTNQGDGNQPPMYFLVVSTDFDFESRGDGGASGTPVAVETNDTVSADTWYHVAVTHDVSTKTVAIFLDGTQKQSYTYTTWETDTQGDLFIGSLSNDTFYFTGYMDEIRFSDSVRYTTSFTPQTTPFTNDPNTLLLIHGDGTVEDDGGTDYGEGKYIIQQQGGVAVVESKNPLAISVLDYQGQPWDGTVDLVLRGLNKIQQTTQGVESN